MRLELFPYPRQADLGDRVHDYGAARWVRVVPNTPPRLRRHICDLTRRMDGVFARPLQVTAGAPATGGTFLTVAPPREDLPEQGYTLTGAEGGVLLEGGGEEGLLYGLRTLEQIVEQTGSHVPEFQILDTPDFPNRGLMLDVSRCKVPTMETLRGIVDLMSRLKLNQLQLYTEHTFAFSAHEVVWWDASPMRPQQVLELDRYCRERFVQLVPNLNSFGHLERWLKHPEYRHLAECPDGFEYPWGGRSEHGSVLRPSQESLDFLAELYREFLPNFSSALFNVGCDETWELGQGRSRQESERRGTTRVYLDFLLRISQLVRRHDRRMMFWGDIILHEPDLIGELPEGVIPLEWGYEADHDFDGHGELFQRAGATFYVCPGTSSWNSLTGRTANATANLRNAAENGLKHEAVGYLVTDWGDNGHHQYLPISYPGYVTAAGLSWCAAAHRPEAIGPAVDRLLLKQTGCGLGALILELGRVGELLPVRVRNGTVFNRMLFSPVGTGDFLQELDAVDLRESLERLDGLEARIGGTRAGGQEGQLVKRELANAVAMARCGLQKGLLGLGDAGTCGEAVRHGLQRLIGRHERLWLERNRPGGLRESSGRLRDQLHEL